MMHQTVVKNSRIAASPKENRENAGLVAEQTKCFGYKLFREGRNRYRYTDTDTAGL